MDLDRRTLLRSGVGGGTLALAGAGGAAGVGSAQLGTVQNGEYSTTTVSHQRLPVTVSVSHPDPLVEGVDNLVVVDVRVRPCASWAVWCGHSVYNPSIAAKMTEPEAASITHVIPGGFPEDPSLQEREEFHRALGYGLEEPWKGGKHATFTFTVRPSRVEPLPLEVLFTGSRREESTLETLTTEVTLPVGPRPERGMTRETFARDAERRATLASKLGTYFSVERSVAAREIRDAMLHVNMMSMTMLASETFGAVVGLSSVADYLWTSFTTALGSPFKAIVGNTLQTDTDGDGLPDQEVTDIAEHGPPFYDKLLGDAAELMDWLDGLTSTGGVAALNHRAASAVLFHVLADLAREEARAWRAGRVDDATALLRDEHYVVGGEASGPVDWDRIQRTFRDHADVGAAFEGPFGSTPFIMSLGDEESYVEDEWRSDLVQHLTAFLVNARGTTDRNERLAASALPILKLYEGQHNKLTDFVEFLENDGLRRDESAGWLVERFMERNSADNPYLGVPVAVEGTVLFDSAEGSDAEWEPARLTTHAGDAGDLFPLADPVLSRFADGRSVTDRRVLVVAGTESADQRHYDKYDKAPLIPAVVGSETDLSGVGEGDRVRVEGHAEWGSGVTFEGPVFTATGASRVDSQVGGDVLAVQHADGSTATTLRETVDYSHARDLAYPTPGSVVWYSGERGGGPVAVERQRILVGDATPAPVWGRSEPPDGSDDTDDQSRPVDVVAVMDVSGSMSSGDTRSGQSRLGVAKESVVGLVNFLSSETRFGLVSFSSGARTEVPLRPVGPETRPRFENAVRALSTRGGTSIGAGLRRAYRMLTTTSAPGRSRTIILLSDGHQNDPPTVESVLPEIASAGITVYTIGMGDANRSLLERVAAVTGGSAEFAPRPGDIRALYQRFSTAAQNRAHLAETSATLSEGESVDGTAAVDASVSDVQFSLTYPGSEIRLSVTRPSGDPLREGDPDVDHRVAGTSEVWAVDDPRTGEWSFTATATQLSRPETASVVVNADSPVTAGLYVTPLYETAGVYKFALHATGERGPYTGASAALAVEHDDRTWTVPLADGGSDGDAVAGDGIYTGFFYPPRAGEYTITARLRGGVYDGLRREFSRTLAVSGTVDTPERYYRTGGEATGTAASGLPVSVGGSALVVAALAGLLYRRLRESEG